MKTPIYIYQGDPRVIVEPEIWKDIPGYEGKYQASSFGRIRNYKDRVLLPWKYKGYLYVDLLDRSLRSHRLIAKAFIPNPLSKPQVNHKNGIKDDNRVENLEWCTNSENAIHAYRILKKKKLVGEANPISKLTDKLVLAIRQRHTECNNIAVVAREFKITIQGAWGIIKRKQWTHI